MAQSGDFVVSHCNGVQSQASEQPPQSVFHPGLAPRTPQSLQQLIVRTSNLPLVNNLSLQQQQQENVRQNMSELQLGEELQPLPLNGSPAVETPAAPTRNLVRVSIPWGVDGVEELALQVIFAIKIWDMEARNGMIIMQQQKKGIELFVSTLQHRFGITLSKYPVWGTIENGAKKTLSRHKAKLNKEKNAVTGDGDRDADQEMSTEEFHKKQNRDKFYDSMVVLLETYLELKKVILPINTSVCIFMYVHNSTCAHVYMVQHKKKQKAKDKRKATELLRAGKHTMNAALGNLAKRMKADRDAVVSNDSVAVDLTVDERKIVLHRSGIFSSHQIHTQRFTLDHTFLPYT